MTDVYGTQEKKIGELSGDDLTEINGIGTTTAEKLYKAKILTVQQIAEMTPEKLSETPGVGLTTAKKFIAAAKNYLDGSQKEDFVSETNQIQDIVKVESVSKSIEKYEIEQVIVEEIEEIEEIYKEPQKEVEEDIKHSQAYPKWFPDKHNYSRLTASDPPISEQIKNTIDTVEEEQEEHTVVGPKIKEFADDVELILQPKIEQLNDYEEEEPIRESTIVDYPPIQPKTLNFVNSQDNSLNSSIQLQISKTFKDMGCYEIPRSLDALKRFTNTLDYLGCKLVKASDDLRFLFLFPVKWFDQEGTVLVDETKLELKSHSKKKDLGTYNDIEQISKNLLHTRDLMYKDIANDLNFLNFFQKYLQITLSFERGFGNNSLVFLSGTTQFKVFIEPILLCSNPPRSMEKSLVFPYQRSSNLHAVSRIDLAPLIRFVEKKYYMIEKRTKKTSSIRDYRQAEETLRSNVKYASIPIFGYSVALLVIYFAELYFLLRLLNTIGFAVVGIYVSLLAFFYFRAYKTKKEFKDQFETPYYLQNLEFSETDLLDFKAELTDELLTQFGYECLGKEAKFGVLEQSEKNALKQSVGVKRSEPEISKMLEPEQIKTENVSKPTTKYGSKYLSFLEDS